MKKLFNGALNIGKKGLRWAGQGVLWFLKNQPTLIFKAFDQKTFAYKNATALGSAVKVAVTSIEEYIEKEDLPSGLSASETTTDDE